MSRKLVIEAEVEHLGSEFVLWPKLNEILEELRVTLKVSGYGEATITASVPIEEVERNEEEYVRLLDMTREM